MSLENRLGYDYALSCTDNFTYHRSAMLKAKIIKKICTVAKPKLILEYDFSCVFWIFNYQKSVSLTTTNEKIRRLFVKIIFPV